MSNWLLELDFKVRAALECDALHLGISADALAARILTDYCDVPMVERIPMMTRDEEQPS
jgi:hypothetical protein